MSVSPGSSELAIIGNAGHGRLVLGFRMSTIYIAGFRAWRDNFNILDGLRHLLTQTDQKERAARDNGNFSRHYK